MKRSGVLFAVCAVLNAVAVCAGDGVNCAFKDIAVAPGFKDSTWGLSVKYADTGREIIACDKDKDLVPASILKLFTTAAALDLFGPAHKFKTRVYMDGSVSNGVLNGVVYIRGGGDPSFGSNLIKGAPSASEEFGKWTNALKAAGITGINGRIIADDSLFEGPLLPGSWSWEDVGNYYAAQPAALSINDNLYKLYLRPGSKVGEIAAVLRVEPEIPGLAFTNLMKTGPEGSGDQGYIFNSPENYDAVLKGTVPKGPAEFVIKGAIPDPALLAAQRFSDYLAGHGIKVTDKATRISRPADYGAARFVAETEGAPLENIVFITNKRSFNLYAEMLLRHLALAREKPGTADNGIAVLKNYLADIGLDSPGLRIFDASGLSRLNSASAEQFTALLCKITKKGFFKVYLASLPSPADPDTTGHIRKMGAGTALEKNLKIKSGSLKGVRAYTGYLTTKKGRLLTFASIINNYTASPAEIDRVHERILLELMKKY